MNKPLNKIETNKEEESFSCFNNPNSSNDYPLDNNSLNTCEFNYLYFLDKKNSEIKKDSSYLIKINDKKIIKFKTENNQLDKLLKQKLKKDNEDSSFGNSNLKEVRNLKKFKKRKKLNKKKPHTSSADDNILRKIQVKFLSFIISYTNDVIRSLSNGKKMPLFQDLSYEIKKKVNHRFVESLKIKTIGDIVKFKITPKIKKDVNINTHIYDIVVQKCPIIKEFFKGSYLNLFKEYYYNPGGGFKFNGKDILLSPRTEARTFNSLINKNFRLREKIKYVTINYYLNTYKRLKKPNFKIDAYNKSNQKKKMQ